MYETIKTRKQLEHAWNDLKTEILSRPLFTDNSAKAKAERKERCKDNVQEFGRTYFPEYVSKESAKFHKEWEEIRKIENKPVLVKAFRGSGKSTYFNFLDPIHSIAYGLRNFMLFSSYTEDKSGIFTGRMLLELQYNQRLKNDFGEFILPNRPASTKYFVAEVPGSTGKTVGVKAISIGQDPRGYVQGPFRPDYVRLDDIQNRQRARSQKFVRNTIEWITQDLVPALAEGYSLITNATPLNTQCVASTLEKGSDDIAPMKTYNFPAVVRGKPAWKDAFPLSRLEAIKKSIGSRAFNQEFLLIPTPLNERIFPEESIRGYAIEELIGMPFSYIYSWTDPSIKHEDKHCYKATVCAGITEEGIIYVLKARVRQESIPRMVDGMYVIYNTWNPSWMFYEDNGGQAILGEVFSMRAEKEGYHLPYRPITNTINKHTRIEGTLSAPIENGIIRFLKTDPDQKELIDQLIQFPDGTYVDGPDALEGVVRMLLAQARKKNAGGPESKRRRESHVVLRGY